MRGPIHRLFGVVGVHVQTAGGGRDGEIVLPALAAPDVEALRDAVGRRRAAAAVGRSRRRPAAGPGGARCSSPPASGIRLGRP